jgi:hypothetical protein
MSSTEEARIRKFHARLVEAALRLRQRGITSFFPMGPDPQAATWYVDGPQGEPELIELEERACGSLLQAHWKRQGLHELAELAGPLMELAGKLKAAQDPSADVSPFIYVMY